MLNTVNQTVRVAETLFEAFEKTAARLPGQIAFKADGGRGRQYTYLESHEIIKQLANGLGSDALADCSEIGLLAENRPEWCMTYLAITAAGKTVVPIDANLKPSEMSYVIRHARLKVVFTSGRFHPILSREHPDTTIYSFDDPHNGWQNLFSSENPRKDRPASEVAALIYTSGTTGEPKAVELTHRNMLANFEGIRPCLPFGQNDTFLSVLPLHHTFEATCGFLTPLFSGSTIVYARSLKSKEILEDIAGNGVTVMCGVPLLYEKMHHSIRRKIQSASLVRRILFEIFFALSRLGWMMGFKWGKFLFRGLRRRAQMTRMRMFVSGGAALPPNINRFFNMLGLDLQQGYGMTECSPVISVNKPDDSKFASVGPPLHNLEVKIFEPDEKGIGEIIVRGESVTAGYRGRPKETAELIRGGWLHTGDLGRLKDGHLWITGRKKNLIVSAAGKNIYPEQIEEKLLESAYILETVVFGRRKKDKQGEDICAIIVPDLEQFKVDFGLDPAKPDMGKVEQVINEEVEKVHRSIADYKRITDLKIQLEELEKTSSKKVKRFVYKQSPDSQAP
ncbi:MAG: AMP-binding protein [Candidatus Zixiibacteriota bacterium]